MNREHLLIAAMGMAAAALAFAAGPRPYHVRVIFSLTESAPKGWFLVTPATIPRPGDYVLAHIPPAAGALADERGYLAFGTPVVKRVAAVQGQVACIHSRQVLVDGAIIGMTLEHDGRGRPLAPWNGCRALGDEVFLIGDRSPASFDSRYFGPVLTTAIVGKVASLWTW